MSLRPPSSRSRLEWKVFTQEGRQNWKLVLPRYYASLFEASFPTLLNKTGAEFRNSKNGKHRIVTLAELEDRDANRIQAFLDWYKRTVCLNTNKYISEDFSNELDFCVALDMLRPAPREDRTEIGEWEFQAKYSQCSVSLSKLAGEMSRAIRVIPLQILPKPRVLTFVPSDPNKKFHMPAELADLIMDGIAESFWATEAPALVPRLSTAKKSAKDMTVAQKIAQWDKLVEAKAIQLSRPVKGCSVIVVDDLYQSGVSMWSFAKYLKNRQATAVVGLACVKSLRDTDNK